METFNENNAIRTIIIKIKKTFSHNEFSRSSYKDNNNKSNYNKIYDNNDKAVYKHMYSVAEPVYYSPYAT